MITASSLHDILQFDFEAGKMYWRPRAHATPQWNGRYAGKEAFTSDNGGYKRGSISGRLYLAHRVIYAAAHDEWPDLIDHINRNPRDNRLSNLRSANRAGNAYNSKIRADNVSGVSGVSWNKRRKCWRAYLTVLGSQKHLGFYENIEMAAAARSAAFDKLTMEPR